MTAILFCILQYSLSSGEESSDAVLESVLFLTRQQELADMSYLRDRFSLAKLGEMMAYELLDYSGSESRVRRFEQEDRVMSKAADMERVRANTPAEINWRIDRQIEDSVRRYANEPKDVILRRIWELEREWDIERVLQLMASSVSLTGIFLSGVRDKRWIVLPVAVLSFLFFHAVQGWCPPVPVLRRLGVRTREEIDRERHALKVLVGDFPSIGNLQPGAATH